MKRITHAILKRLVHVKNISIPNYLTDKQLYPELLCNDASPERIVHELENYLLDNDIKLAIDSGLNEAKKLMGTDNAAEFWAKCVFSQ